MPTELTATRLLGRGRDATRRARCYRVAITTPGRPTEELRIDRLRARIGSRAENEIAIEDDSVSRLHAEITLDEHGFRYRDLGSRNGSAVDGARANDVYLRAGARIEIGRSTLVFEPLADEHDVEAARTESFGELVGASAAMRELFARLARVAPADATVLVLGESGTGKELVARAIHDASERRGHELVVFDCASVTATLLEAELFGHEKGAFTGASGRRVGAVSAAEGGTLFLDEIGELPLELQPKLLRLLERKEARPVGASRWEPADVRIVAATNRDLAAEVNRGTFREDLYYRLAVFEVHVPPLRERPDDLPLLVRHLVEAAVRGDRARARRALDGISAEGWERLRRHPFPGNVRELRNVVERMVVLGEAPEPPPVAVSVPMRGAPEAIDDASTDDPALGRLVDPSRPWMAQKRALVGALEDAYLRAVLDAHGGNITQAAAAAGIERMYFKRLLRKRG